VLKNSGVKPAPGAGRKNGGILGGIFLHGGFAAVQENTLESLFNLPRTENAHQTK